jgi:hypothetical protein
MLRRCVRFLTAMMPVRSCLCTDRACRARILALDSGTLTGAGFREAGTALRELVNDTRRSDLPDGAPCCRRRMLRTCSRRPYSRR